MKPTEKAKTETKQSDLTRYFCTTGNTTESYLFDDEKYCRCVVDFCCTVHGSTNKHRPTFYFLESREHTHSSTDSHTTASAPNSSRPPHICATSSFFARPVCFLVTQDLQRQLGTTTSVGYEDVRTMKYRQLLLRSAGQINEPMSAVTFHKLLCSNMRNAMSKRTLVVPWGAFEVEPTFG